LSQLIQLANNAVFDYTYDEIKKAKGFNYSKKKFLETSELNAELAKDIVADWYNTGANYNYDEEPTSETAGKIIVMQIIFIKTFL